MDRPKVTPTPTAIEAASRGGLQVEGEKVLVFPIFPPPKMPKAPAFIQRMSIVPALTMCKRSRIGKKLKRAALDVIMRPVFPLKKTSWA